MTLKEADLWIKAIGGLIAFVGATLAALKYFDERKKANKTARLDARKPYATKQQEIYAELLNVTGTISNRFGHEDWEPAFARFWVTFWGLVPLVADENVSRAVDQFADTLEHLDNGIAMRNASMDLARACRRSLGDSWSEEFAIYVKTARTSPVRLVGGGPSQS